MYESEPDQKRAKIDSASIAHEQEEVLKKLSKRLEEHDESRKAVQEKLHGICNNIMTQVNDFEINANSSIEDSFTQEDNRFQAALSELEECASKGTEDEGLRNAMEVAKAELEIGEEEGTGGQERFVSPKDLIKMLKEKIETNDDKRRAGQEKVDKICSDLKKQVSDFEEEVNRKIEESFTREDNRLQTTLNELRSFNGEKGVNLENTIKNVQMMLFVKQSYEIKKSYSDLPYMNSEDIQDKPELTVYFHLVSQQGNQHGGKNNNSGDERVKITDMYHLQVLKELAEEFIKIEEIPTVKFNGINGNDVYLNITRPPDEERALRESGSRDAILYRARLSKDGRREEYPLIREGKDKQTENLFFFSHNAFEPNTLYTLEIKAFLKDRESKWSDEIVFRTPDFQGCCIWKEWTDNIDKKRKYSLDRNNPRIALKTSHNFYCTIIGNIPLPLKKVVSWNIKILKSKDNDGNGIYVGVAPSNIDQSIGDNSRKCGWYFDCYRSTLHSGPPRNNSWGKVYGSWKGDGEYVHTGDIVSVVMDTTKGELSFIVNGIGFGVAFEGIPLDKPLVPCALIRFKDDSIELDTSESKERINGFMTFPSKISAWSITWDSITLAWKAVEGATYYQVEFDGITLNDLVGETTFTKRWLNENTTHILRVRTARGNAVSEWSEVILVTTKRKSFKSCWWKDCPSNIEKIKGYYVYTSDPRVASKIAGFNYYLCTIIGNVPIPPNKVTSWNIKILEPRYNDGSGVFIGVAPSDINQNENNNYRCGWYFYCHDSTLLSGPPHNYTAKEYGPRKEEGEYVHTGDSVGVVMDTAKGELSFYLGEVNYGVAYEGIPLDKPLVPCVLLWHKGDSIGLDTSEVKETTVDSSITVPSNITTKCGITWDSITLTWNAVEGTSFYQIEVDGSKSWETSTTNSFIKRGLLPDTEHTFRVRAVRGNSVSEWSGVAKKKTQKKSFETSAWKECPDYVYEQSKYSVDEKNPRVATKIGGDCWCTIIGNTPLPLNKVTSWSIKVLKSKRNNGRDISIGVAPSDIDQNEDYNINNCGWSFDCYWSELCSGPPHNYDNKEYGPRKGEGKYVHNENNIEIAMNTTKGELSFALKGVNLGVAYKGIPLDKPLVPCVFLWWNHDKIELGSLVIN